MPKTLLTVAVALVLAALPAAAAERTLRLDPAKSEIAFTLGATLHTVEGTARLRSGEIRFDPESGEASGRIVVATASADTGNQGRDRDMHAKVLESARYPEIAFTPEAISGTFDPGGASHLTLRGRLEIHGASHPLSLDVAVEAEGARLTARTAFAVPYVEWGMKDPSKFVLRVEKHVDVTVMAVGELDPAGAGSAAGGLP
jgi:polyisoprenoid-binding protein YceI